MPSARQRAWTPWAIVCFLFTLCAFLAFLQNRWLDEVSRAEKQRLHEDLQDKLELIRQDLDGQVRSAIASVTPSVEQILQLGGEKAAALQLKAWNNANRAYFRNASVVKGGGYGPEFDPEADRRDPALIEVAIPGSPDRLLVELDLEYLQRVTFPALLARYLDSGTKVGYEAEVVSGRDRTKILFQTDQGLDFTKRAPDASVGLLDFHHFDKQQNPGPLVSGPPPGPPAGRWRLLVRYDRGALNAIVARARWQNAGISAGLLSLILATGAVLVSYSRRAHRLAELQFNFVTGVSHELRTPITVIRTAAFNLRGKSATQPGQAERYGRIIQEEGEKLSVLVEQVLAFASARSLRGIQPREPVAVDRLIEQILDSTSVLRDPRVKLEKHLDAGLPLILADPVAIRNAVNNLLENALKYGLGHENRIVISARAITVQNGQGVEIGVTDYGPGIPVDEQSQLFEPFFRGRGAVEDQIHGTGLGLSLVRSIIEAHGGSASVASQLGEGTTVTLRLPAATAKHQNEFANSTG